MSLAPSEDAKVSVQELVNHPDVFLFEGSKPLTFRLSYIEYGIVKLLLYF